MTDKNIIAGAPTEEPARQQYFMEQVKKLVETESAKKGRPLTCFINTFGCQMNARDSEKLLGILKEAGYEEGTDENSDFVLYNTCTVRENANLKVYGRLGYLSGVKRKNPDMMIALCGCMMHPASTDSPHTGNLDKSLFVKLSIQYHISLANTIIASLPLILINSATNVS